jgi:hypothetical protein
MRAHSERRRVRPCEGRPALLETSVTCGSAAVAMAGGLCHKPRLPPPGDKGCRGGANELNPEPLDFEHPSGGRPAYDLAVYPARRAKCPR